MNKKELQHITNLREDLYQAMLIGSIKLNNKSVADLYNFMNYQDKEIERLNNIIDELKNWFKGYHKSQSCLSWYEEDYIEFIEYLEKELKGGDEE